MNFLKLNYRRARENALIWTPPANNRRIQRICGLLRGKYAFLIDFNRFVVKIRFESGIPGLSTWKPFISHIKIDFGIKYFQVLFKYKLFYAAVVSLSNTIAI